MHSAIYAVASGPSVRLSVTILYCVKTPKRVETLSLPVRSSLWLSQNWTFLQNSDVIIHNVGQSSSLHTTSLDYGRRAFSVAGPSAWNCLSDELREPLLTANSFRQLLIKTRLFAEY